MRVTEIDLVTFIEDVSSYFDNMAQSKQIQYSFQHDVSSVMLWVDTDKMEKILANLLSNAFKFTPDGEEWLQSVCRIMRDMLSFR